MKILMFGAGVINTIYGYALAQAGNDVTHYVRPGKKKMFGNGISLNFLDGRANPPKQASAHYDAKIAEEFSSADDYELVIVSVRHYQLDSVLPILKDKVGNADVLIFNGNWNGFDNLDQYLPRSQFVLGFPVAGGGYSGTTLDGALLEEIRLGELDGKSTPRLERIKQVFEGAGLKVDLQANMQHWLWVHFAINSGIIGSAFKAGSASKLLNSIPHLRKGILAGREALAVCRARGVNVDSFEDAKSFYLPAWLSAVAVWFMMKTNLPARKIMETHTAVDELQVIYRDVKTFLKDKDLLRECYASTKELLELCERRGVDLKKYPETGTFNLPVWLFIPLFRLLYTYNQSMQRFTAHAADSLQEARENFDNIMRTANELSFDMPHTKAVGMYLK